MQTDTLKKNDLFSTHMHSESREMNKAAVSHHGASQMTNSDMVGSKSERTGTDRGVSRAAVSLLQAGNLETA